MSRRTKHSFTLVEVMIAMGIVGIAIGSSFQIFYTVKRLNERARFYATVLPFVRQEMNAIVTNHVLFTPTGTTEKRHGDIEYQQIVEADSAPYGETCQRVTLRFKLKERSGVERWLTFVTYVSTAIRNEVEQEE